MRTRVLNSVGAGMCFASALCAGSFGQKAAPAWPQFRGPNGSGVLEPDTRFTEFGPRTNLLWKIALPPGVSSPSVWEDRIFLTAFENSKFETICVRRDDGKFLWRQVAPIDRVEPGDPKGSPASATPATDGEGVYVYLSCYGLLAYDMEGRELWRKPLPIPELPYGSGTSPALMEDLLLINLDQEGGKSSLLALHRRSGTTKWEAPRPEFRSSYSTPVLWKRPEAVEVVVAGSYRLVGYDLSDGKEAWSARGLEAFDVCPTPVLGDDQLYAMSYSFGGGTLPPFAELAKNMDKNGDHQLSLEEARPFFSASGFNLVDRNKDQLLTAQEWKANIDSLQKGEHGLFAVRAPGSGDITSTHVAWRQKRAAATVSSPLYYRGRVYVVQDGGRVSCFDSRSGQPLYEQERLHAEGEYYASPVAADGKIYFASKRGVLSVIEDGGMLKVAAKVDIAAPIMATPALAADHLYVRTSGHLWAFAAAKQ